MDKSLSLCPYLKNPAQGKDSLCDLGINFAYIGSNRDICRVCPISNISRLPLCNNAEIQLFVNNELPEPAIEVKFYCYQNSNNSTESRCAACPNN